MKRDSDDMDESAHVSQAGARLALRWRDQAFRLAFRRAGGILPRFAGTPTVRTHPTHREVAEVNSFWRLPRNRYRDARARGKVTR